MSAIWRAPAVPAAQAPAARWWSHVAFLASDEMQGRETGSPQHRKAAEYVAEHFAKAGLRTTLDGKPPGRPDAFIQTVAFSSSKIVEQKSSLALVRNGIVGRVSVVILPGSTTEFGEQGAVLRLVELTEPLQLGRSYPLKLAFERGGLVNATLNVDYENTSLPSFAAPRT